MPVKRGSHGKIVEEPSRPGGVRDDTDLMGDSLFGGVKGASDDDVHIGGKWDKPTEPMGKRGGGQDDKTRVLRPKRQPDPTEGPRTDEGDDPMADPPVGWLVVISGPGQGRVLTLGNGMNAIGRGPGSRVRMDFGDDGISRANHARLAYEPRQRQFLLGHGEGTNLTYLNNEVVLESKAIESGATIQIGETKLRFQAFCGETFDWVDVDDRKP